MSHQIKEISKFFISEARQKMLINSIKEHTQDSQKRGYLISVLLDVLKKKTGLDDFEDLFVPTVICLEEISLNMERVYVIKIHHQKLLHFIN